jgi:2-haloacid dehalogenase
MTQFQPSTGTGGTSAPSLLIFDVNETLIDIESLGPHFERIFGDAAVLRTWFGELVTYSMTLTVSGLYVDFFTLGQAVLQMVAKIRGADITDADRHGLGEAMRTMPAHPDVEPGLQRLLDSGHRLVTLTNSPHRPDVPSPLDNAGLSHYFERQFSVDSARVYKPSGSLYRDVAADLGVAVADCMMVAAHTWDNIGAQAVGLRAALITRAGNAALVAEGIPQPDVVAANLIELASLLEPAKGADTAPL